MTKMIKAIQNKQITEVGILYTLRNLNKDRNKLQSNKKDLVPTDYNHQLNNLNMAIEFCKLFLTNFKSISKVKLRMADKY